MEQGKEPYKGYKIYKIYHSKEERYYAVIWKSSSERTTKSWAKYVMETHLGRELLSSEEVDHINNNKQDDRIENLQILTRQENCTKYQSTIKDKLIELSCTRCDKTISRPINGFTKTKNHFCDRKCEYLYIRESTKPENIRHGTSGGYSTHKCRCNLCKMWKKINRND